MREGTLPKLPSPGESVTPEEPDVGTPEVEMEKNVTQPDLE